MAERTEVTKHSEGKEREPRGGAPKGKTGGKAGKKNTWRETPAGRVLELFIYLIMLLMVLVYFTGKGLFIYEGF